MFDKFETDKVVVSFFSENSPPFTGHSWELKDLLNKDDNIGSNCLDAKVDPAKAAGWNNRLGIS